MANPLATAIFLEWLARSKEDTAVLPLNSARYRRRGHSPAAFVAPNIFRAANSIHAAWPSVTASMP